MKTITRYIEEIKYNSCYENICNAEESTTAQELLIGLLNNREKASVTNCMMLNQLPRNRQSHILNTYFLGLVLYKNCQEIKKLIDKSIEKLSIVEKNEDRFEYLWYMICLFHDLGYIVEDSNIPEELLKSTKLPSIGLKNQNVPKIFTKKTVTQYMQYRKQHFKKFDHGVYGAIIAYNEWKNIKAHAKQDGTNLNWTEVEEAWKIAYRIILVHNIYFAHSGTYEAELYRHTNLENLIVDNYPIKLFRHPLLFLFCLIDSIEPTKRDVSTSMVEIGFDKDNKITIQLLDLIKPTYAKTILSLDTWLTHVEIEAYNKMIIHLSDNDG